jgi:hypothetical protein
MNACHCVFEICELASVWYMNICHFALPGVKYRLETTLVLGPGTVAGFSIRDLVLINCNSRIAKHP